jgi:hypothetical protein
MLVIDREMMLSIKINLNTHECYEWDSKPQSQFWGTLSHCESRIALNLRSVPH